MENKTIIDNDVMNFTKALQVIKAEQKCVRKSRYCNRECADCELVQDERDLEETYRLVEFVLQKIIEKGEF